MKVNNRFLVAMRAIFRRFILAHKVLLDIQILFRSPTSLMYLAKLIARRQIIFEKRHAEKSIASMTFYLSGDLTFRIIDPAKESEIRSFINAVKFHLRFISTIWYLAILLPLYGYSFYEFYVRYGIYIKRLIDISD